VGKSRLSGRVGNERLITDLLGRMGFGQSPCTARSVAVFTARQSPSLRLVGRRLYGSSVAACGSFGRIGIRIGGRGGTPVWMPCFRCTRRIRGDVVVFGLRWGSPS
jgi:hypothetical protein